MNLMDQEKKWYDQYIDYVNRLPPGCELNPWRAWVYAKKELMKELDKNIGVIPGKLTTVEQEELNRLLTLSEEVWVFVVGEKVFFCTKPDFILGFENGRIN